MVARASLRQIAFNLVVTNVPGPQFPLYCQGARLVEVFPIAFLYEGQQLSIAIFSYCGMLNFGYLVDAQGISDVDVFAECVEEGLRELVEAARVAAERARRRRSAVRGRSPSVPVIAKSARKPSSTKKRAVTARTSATPRKSPSRHRGAA